MPATQPTKKWYEFQNAANGKPARIVIEDGIGCWGQTAASFRSDFSRLGENEAVEIHIKSGGGSVFEGGEIANIISSHKGDVNVTLGSICASIATVIACAGKKIKAAKNTLWMIHEPTVYAGGDAKELRKMAGILDKIRSNLVAVYEKKTGKTKDELLALIADETWFTAEEAKEAGFVDEVSNEDADDDVVDNVDLSHYENTTRLFALRMKDAAEAASKLAGNGGRLSLAAIRNSLAGKPPEVKTKPDNNTQQKPTTMTDAEKAALEAENQKKIDEGVNRKLQEMKNRRTEVLNIVTQERKRTGVDFSAEAETFLNDGDKPAHAFMSIILASDKKPAPIGSGIEVIEPLDGYKGTPGFAFVNSPEFRALGEVIKRRGGSANNIPVNITVPTRGFQNTTHTSTATSGSGLTSIEKLPGVLQLGVRPLTVEDLIAGGATNNTTVRYIQEVSYTQSAAAVLEQGTLPTVNLTYQEIDAPVKDIGGMLKMSENLMADYVAVAAFINVRLPYQVDRAVDDQLMNGSGSGANITGILNTSGIQTLAKGGDTISDLALKLQTLVRWQNMSAGAAQGGFEPTGYIIHPTDWESYQLAKDANGQYLMRGPFYGAYGNGAVEFYTLWGKPVAVSPVTAQGTIVCGAWRMGAQKFDRQGLIIEMTNSDGTDFQTRTITLRGTRRLALAVYRPGSFVTGTGL